VLSALVRAALSLFGSKTAPDAISIPSARRLAIREAIRRGFED
jgi:hypothetical protein